MALGQIFIGQASASTRCRCLRSTEAHTRMLALLVLSLPLTSASQARCSRMLGLSPTTAKRFCRTRRTVTSILTPGWTGAFSIICYRVFNSATCHIRCQHCRLFLLLRWDQLHTVSVCVEIGLTLNPKRKKTQAASVRSAAGRTTLSSLAWLSITF